MIFTPTAMPGVWTIDPTPHRDARGSFTRLTCAAEFADHGLPGDFPQCSLSANRRRGTLRGLHYQAPPHAEGKLVRCLRGAIFDVVLDLRAHTPSFGRWLSLTLTAGHAVFIPPGLAHGFQTLADDSDVLYHMSVPHHAAAARGIAWNDPDLGIPWPIAAPLLSARDAALPSWAHSFPLPESTAPPR